MQRMTLDQVTPGMILGKPVYNDRGDTLLRAGVTLTAQWIYGLREHGYYTVYVRDGVADDVAPPDVLSPALRSLTFKHMYDLFTMVESVSEVQDLGEQRERLAQFAEAARPQFVTLCRDVQRIVQEISNVETLSGIVPLRNHDSYTFDHSVEVTIAGVMLGRRLMLTTEELHQLALGCLFHDIGKMAVPRKILTKPTRLTSEEYAVVQRHPEAGYEAVQLLTGSSDIIARHVVRQHHERQDGKGYPRRLKGNGRFASGRHPFGQGLMLPAAEIAGVADVYAALASDRPYRRAMAPAEIVTTLQSMAGSHLNREVVNRFLTILPAYPVSTEVVVISPKLRGYRGVVTAVHPSNLGRPTVRILFDPHARTIAPFEVNTLNEKQIEIATSSYAQLAGFDPNPAGKVDRVATRTLSLAGCGRP